MYIGEHSQVYGFLFSTAFWRKVSLSFLTHEWNLNEHNLPMKKKVLSGFTSLYKGIVAVEAKIKIQLRQSQMVFSHSIIKF